MNEISIESRDTPLLFQVNTSHVHLLPLLSTSENNKVIDNEILETDHSRKPSISKYHSNIQNDVRKSYLKKGLLILISLDNLS